MKRYLLSALLLSLGIFLSGSLFAQTWAEVIEEDRGDTVVVKGTSNSGIQNTMAIAIMGDTTLTGDRTNPNRVYETMPGEVYISDVTAEFDATVPNVRITAPRWEMDDTIAPPLHIRNVKGDGTFDKTFFQTPGSLYAENQYFLLALLDGQRDREFARAEAPENRFEYDHCIFELTNWVLHFPRALHQTFKFTNNLFLNVGYEATLEKGCVFDSWMMSDTLWFENNTVLNAGNISLARPHAAPNFAYYNHNTFVNSGMPPFLYYSQAEMIVTNNIIMNQGTIPDYPGFYTFYEDEDQLPKGIINADTVEAAWKTTFWPVEGDSLSNAYPVASEADRKILFDNNDVWWDPRFQTMFEDSLPAFPDTITETWASQMILMNSRTQAMFDDDASYPYFNEGEQYNVDPGFTDNQDLVWEWVRFIVSNATPGDPNGGGNMPWWRTYMETDATLVNIDWPPLADLTYSDVSLLGGGRDGYPVGDLNWYPDDMETWMAANESEALIAELKTPVTSIDEKSFEGFNSSLEVFPNPFGEMATVRFDISRSANLELSVYNILGERVRRMELGQYGVGVHEVNLNKGDLGPGLYIIQLNTDTKEVGMISKISIK